MATITPSVLVETLSGKMTNRHPNGRITVSRRKCFGKDSKGRPFLGPNESYEYHLHTGEWSPAATANRQLFKKAQVLARQELNDPQLKAAWVTKFNDQIAHRTPGQKQYVQLLGFVVAQIHADLKLQALNANLPQQ